MCLKVSCFQNDVESIFRGLRKNWHCIGCLHEGRCLCSRSRISRRNSMPRGDAHMAFELPNLPYDYDALAPYMSRETLEYHHDKHHLAYVTNGNKLAEEAGLADLSLEEIVKKSYGTNQPLFNNAGQHYNHIHFWKWMKKGGGGKSLPGKLEKQITSDIGPIAKLKEEFVQAGVTQFGSGWCWLAVK